MIFQEDQQSTLTFLKRRPRLEDLKSPTFEPLSFEGEGLFLNNVKANDPKTVTSQEYLKTFSMIPDTTDMTTVNNEKPQFKFSNETEEVEKHEQGEASPHKSVGGATFVSISLRNQQDESTPEFVNSSNSRSAATKSNTNLKDYGRFKSEVNLSKFQESNQKEETDSRQMSEARFKGQVAHRDKHLRLLTNPINSSVIELESNCNSDDSRLNALDSPVARKRDLAGRYEQEAGEDEEISGPFMVGVQTSMEKRKKSNSVLNLAKKLQSSAIEAKEHKTNVDEVRSKRQNAAYAAVLLCFAVVIFAVEYYSSYH